MTTPSLPGHPVRRSPRSRVALTAAPAVLVALAAQGCTSGPVECTLIGMDEGIVVEIARPVHDDSRTAQVDVCDGAGCARARTRLHPWPPLPAPLVTFDDLGRDFAPGTVRVSVTLRARDGSTVAARTDDVRLTADHPNGPGCDGDGFLQGTTRITRADRT